MTHARITCLAAIAFLQALAPCQGLFVSPERPDPNRLVNEGSVITQGTLQVEATIRDGTAVTVVRQTLHNASATQQEAFWLLPLPAGAAADRFKMTVGGVETTSEVLPAQKARKIYEDIVRRRKDPGLLEYVGMDLLRARVFPIPAHGDLQVEVRYTQVLRESSGIFEWHYPLRAAWVSDAGPQRVGLKVSIHSHTPIKTIWSPSQSLDIQRDGDHRATIGLELDGKKAPARDLVLYYGLADQDFGAHVLTYREAGQGGYFMALLAPKRDWAQPTGLVRSINFVVDTSGSMKGQKIEQARGAVRSFVQSLDADDWFNVIPFSTDARPFFDEPVLATEENKAKALARSDALEATGGTNIEEALALAMRSAAPDCYKGRVADGTKLVPMCVFLTDGLPTVGTTDIDALLRRAKELNTNRARIFAFGVGDDVNTRLLDTLTMSSRGDRGYVRPGQDLEVATSTLFAKLHGPAMTDVAFSIDGLDVVAVEPRDLPDLFVRGQLVVVGRYDGTGQHALRLRGNVGAAAREYVFEADFPEVTTGNDWLPALWAQQRIAALLEAIRQNGQQKELVDEVTRLGREHGIVTPFTSHLIVEDGERLAGLRGQRLGFGDEIQAEEADRVRAEWGRAGVGDPAANAPLTQLARRARQEATASSEALARKEETGAAAVEKSVTLRELADFEMRDSRGASSLLTRRVAGRVFHLVGGVWIDHRFTAAVKENVRKVAAFGDDYFALLRERPELGPVLAFSTRMVLVVDGQAIEIE